MKATEHESPQTNDKRGRTHESADAGNTVAGYRLTGGLQSIQRLLIGFMERCRQFPFGCLAIVFLCACGVLVGTLYCSAIRFLQFSLPLSAVRRRIIVGSVENIVSAAHQDYLSPRINLKPKLVGLEADGSNRNTHNETWPVALPVAFPPVCIFFNARGGAGNRAVALASWLAVVRAARRDVAVVGNKARIVWREFWESDFPSACPSPLTTREKHRVVTCRASSACIQQIFRETNALIKLTLDKPSFSFIQSSGHEVDALYRRLAPSVMREFHFENLACFMEFPRIFYRPLPPLRNAVNAFLKLYGLGDVSVPGNEISLSLHLRQCVDCGWRMKQRTISENLDCMLTKLRRPLTNGSLVFVTSDSRDNLDLIRSKFPAGIRVVHNLPPKMLHSARSSDVSPYVDAYLMGYSKLVASCFTTYGRLGVMRVPIDRVPPLVVWQHHDEKGEVLNPRCKFWDWRNSTR